MAFIWKAIFNYWKKRAEIHISKREYEKAIDAARRALNIEKNSTEALYSLAYSLTELRRYSEAIPHYRKLNTQRTHTCQRPGHVPQAGISAARTDQID